MQSARVTFVLASTIGAVLARASDGRAQASRPSSIDGIRIDYVAPDGCPNEAVFRARLALRIRDAPSDGAGRAPHALTIRIGARAPGPPLSGHAPNAFGYAGELRIVDADDAESARTVEAATCEELVDALAFIGALSMGIVTRERPQGIAPSPTSAASSPAADRGAGGPPRRAAARSAHAAFSFGGAAVTSPFVGPRVGLGVLAFVEVRREAADQFAPSLRLSGRRVEGSSIEAGAGAASLTLTSLRLDACPIGLRPAPSLSAAPCLCASVGVLHAEATSIARAHSDTEAFVSADLVARVQWSPFADWLALDGELGATRPFLRYDFRFLPNTAIDRVPVVGWVFGLGVAARFP